jgi:hypothetical protein
LNSATSVASVSTGVAIAPPRPSPKRGRTASMTANPATTSSSTTGAGPLW